MSEGVEHSPGCERGRTRWPTCYNLGCRKALSTPACRSQTCTVAVLQPRMSEGVEHPSPPASSPASPARCYNLGCRKALSTMSALQGDDRAFKVLQPRMSEGVEHPRQCSGASLAWSAVLQPRMSEGVEHAGVSIADVHR